MKNSTFVVFYRETPCTPVPAIGFSSVLCAFRVFLPRLSQLIDLPQVIRAKQASQQGVKDRKDFFAFPFTCVLWVCYKPSFSFFFTFINGPKHAEFHERKGNKVNENRK